MVQRASAAERWVVLWGCGLVGVIALAQADS